MSIAGGSPAVLRDVLRNGLPDLVSQRIVDFTFTIHPSNAPEGATLLHLACEFSTVSLIAFLVDVAKVKKEEKDSRGETPLFKAVAKHQFASIHYLVHTAKVNLYSFNNLGLTVLHMGWWAPRAGPMVQFLIEECEMEVDTTDGEGRTILHMLARSGTEDSTVSWLVETQGASVTLADKDGCTALHWAAGYSGSVAAAKILLNHGASIEARNKKGETALFMSCKRGFTVFCRFLVESWNASVHSACPSGQGTLLHASVRSEWTFTMVEFLIEKGVNVYAVNNAAEETCLHMAVKRIAQLGTLLGCLARLQMGHASRDPLY
jgi:ankyrin repeat protein